MEDHPANPIAAVTHANPYPYYADLAVNSPIYFDVDLNCWVAASAEVVTAVLSHELCRVRPLSEPVPVALLGSSAADIFGNLVRMNDGETHRNLKPAVSSTLMSVDITQAEAQAQKWARFLFEGLRPEQYSAFAFQLPVYVVENLLGVPETDLAQVALWMADFVACLAPGADAERVERGKNAARDLLNLFTRLMETQKMKADDSLLTMLNRSHLPNIAILANVVGFLSQSYEATAGLIGNTLVALACQPGLLERVMLEPRLLPAVIHEVVRYDPPVQNTRRYLAGDGIVAGQMMREGEAILVVLAAANRDPQANADPDHFNIHRKDRRSFTFGLGAHACPGETLAVTIAQAGVEQILASGIDLNAIVANMRYRPSANTRIPLFEEQ